MYRCRAWITYADTRRRRRAPWIRDRRSEADLIAPPEPSTAVGPDRDLCACSVFACETGSLPWRHRSSSRREVRRQMVLQQQPARERHLVLIADDDRDIARFLEVNLRLEGFDVTCAHDGNDALAKALELEPNLILLDVMMPGMDGFEVCSKLRADPRGLDVPVIMLTAKSMSNDRTDGFSVGADDYVTKPFEPMELVARVSARLHQTTP